MPVAVEEATDMFMVEEPEPGAAMDVGLKVTVTPVGWPEADKLMDELKPPEAAVVIVDVPLFPCATETEVGEAEMEKLGDACGVTVKETEVVWVLPPPVPVMVIGYDPSAAGLAAATGLAATAEEFATVFPALPAVSLISESRSEWTTDAVSCLARSALTSSAEIGLKSAGSSLELSPVST